MFWEVETPYYSKFVFMLVFYKYFIDIKTDYNLQVLIFAT